MNTPARPETSNGAPHRQWNEILQEMRVMQTGIQILLAFLIILPFQNRFSSLDSEDVIFYVVLLIFAVVLLVLMLVPVLVHRRLFGQQLKTRTVLLGHVIVRLVGISAGVLVVGCVGFVLQVLFGYRHALLISAPLLVLTLGALVLVPWLLERASLPHEQNPDQEDRSTPEHH